MTDSVMFMASKEGTGTLEATPQLRFVERSVEVQEVRPGVTMMRTARILQQLWRIQSSSEVKFEWRDVPLERE